MKPLDAGSIDLWLVAPDEIDEAMLARYRALATPDEQAAASRFHFERHRRSHLVTRAAVRVGALKESDSNRFYLRHGFVFERAGEFDNYYVRPAPGALA